MAKTIKRVGIIFFVLVVSLLVAVGSVFAVNVAVSGDFEQNTTLDNVADTVVEANNDVTPPDTSTPDFKLEGTNSDKITVWNNAVTKSVENKVNVVVKLMNNWDVSSVSDKSFGTGSGFAHGRIYIPRGANITLDLNGKTINRGLTAVTNNGHVILIQDSTLNLVDSSYNAEVALQTARTNSANLKNLPYGKIMGGYGTGGANGAGIRLSSENHDVSILNMYGGIITGNHADGGGGGIGAYANTVLDGFAKVSIYNGIICDNKADNYGGGIYLENKDDVLKIEGGIIANNYASQNGGAILCRFKEGTQISNMLFINNSANYNGGAIYSNGQNNKAIVSDCEFVSNEVISPADTGIGSAGALYFVTNMIVNLQNCIVKDNVSNNYAGGIYIGSYTDLTIKGCKILNNTTTLWGGGIYIGASAKNVVITDTIVDGNIVTGQDTSSCGGGGLVIDNLCNFAKFTNVQITNNESDRYGGGFVAHTKSNVKLDNCTITGNTAGTTGGGMHVSTASSWEITNSFIKNNQSGTYGGGIYGNESVFVNINGCEIENNIATRSGGGLYLNNYATANVHDTKIANNTALSDISNGGGGGIYMSAHSQVKLYSNSSVTNNSALLNTGGIYLFKTANLMLTPTIEIYDNKIKDTDIINDIYLPSDKKLEINEKMNEQGGKKIFINLSTSYDKFATFTTGFSCNNPNVDPSTIFASIDSNKTAVLKNGEVIFEDINKAVYDYIYLDDGIRKNYSENEKMYGYNDSDITEKVLGKITPETSVKEFVQTLNYDTAKLKLYNNKDEEVALTDEVAVVGTGWYIEYTPVEGEATDTIYLSVLGDVTGDGRIDATDITYLRRIANGEIDDLSLAVQLAAMVDNRGKITSIDAEILRAICKYEATIDMYF